MTNQNLTTKLQAKYAEGKHLCVGIDPDPAKIAGDFFDKRGTLYDALYNFCIDRIDRTATSAACFKPNIAFFVAHDTHEHPLGTRVLYAACAYIRKHHGDIPIILDAKDADIGNTNWGYSTRAAKLADAVTLNPYLGEQALRPFLDSDLFCILLARTLNKGADEFQNLQTSVSSEDWGAWSREKPLFPESQCHSSMKPLYAVVAARVAHVWKSSQERGIVCGVTAPDELGRILNVITRETLTLIPSTSIRDIGLDTVMNQLKSHEHRNFVIDAPEEVMYAVDLDDQVKGLSEQISSYL